MYFKNNTIWASSWGRTENYLKTWKTLFSFHILKYLSDNFNIFSTQNWIVRNTPRNTCNIFSNILLCDFLINFFLIYEWLISRLNFSQRIELNPFLNICLHLNIIHQERLPFLSPFICDFVPTIIALSCNQSHILYKLLLSNTRVM